MALSERDIKLLFEAETKGATRDIKTLGGVVRDLRDDITQQASAVEKSDAGLERLKATAGLLKKALSEVGDNQKFVKSLAQAEAKEQAQIAKVEQLREKLGGLQTAYDEAEKKTKTAANAIERVATSLTKAEASLEGYKRNTMAAGEALDKAAGSATTWRAAQDANVKTTQQIAAGLGLASRAVEAYEADLRSASAVKLDQQKFDTLAAGPGAGIDPAQIAAISGYTDRVERLKLLLDQVAAAEREASAAAVAGAARSKAIKDEVNRVLALYNQRIQEAAQADARLAAANGFTAQANKALQAAQDIKRFATANDQAQGSVSRLASTVFELTAPAAAAAQTLGGVAAAIQNAEAVLNKTKQGRVSEYADEANKVAQAIAGLNTIARQVDGFVAQQGAAAKSATAFESAKLEVERLATALKDPQQQTEALARELTQAEAKLNSAGAAMSKDDAILGGLSAALKKAGVDTNNLETEIKQITGAATQAGATLQRLNKQTGGGVGGKFAFLGLKPYEMQNLGYQVQDVISSLASGIPVTQVVAQQGFQITSLFPGLISGTLGWVASLGPLLPILALIAAAITLVVVSVKEVSEAIATAKTVDTLFAGFGESAGASAAQIREVVGALRDVGLSAEEAETSARDLLKSGLDPAAYKEFVGVAKAVAEVTGQELPEALATATDGFNGGFDAIQQLNETFPFLSDAEVEQIRLMYESGNASDARTFAYEKFRSKAEEVASASNGPWSVAWGNLKIAANNFFGAIGNLQAVQDLINRLNQLRQALADAAVGFNYVILLARGFSDAEARAGAVSGAVIKAKNQGGTTDPGGKNARTGKTAGGQNAIREQRESNALIEAGLKLSKAENRQLVENTERRRAFQAAKNKGYSDDEARQLGQLAFDKKRSENQRSLDKDQARADKAAAAAGRKADSAAKAAARKAEAAKKRAAAAAAREARKAEQEQKARERAEEQLLRGVESAEAKAARSRQATLAERLAGIDTEYEALFRKIDEFKIKYGDAAQIDGQPVADLEKRLDTTIKIRKEAETLGDAEDTVNALVDKRDAQLAAIQERYDAGIISAKVAASDTTDVTSAMNTDIQTALISARELMATLAPTPELEKLAAKLDSIDIGSSNLNGSPDARKAAEGFRSAELDRLDDKTGQRDALVAAQIALVETGLQTRQDAEKVIQAAYERTAEGIQNQIDKTKALIEFQKENGQITVEQYELIEAQLAVVSAQLTYIPENVRAVNEAARSAFGQGVTNLVDGLGQGIANLVNRSATLGEVFSDLGRTALSFAASFLKAIADVLIQMLALQAIKAAFGGSLGGGIGGAIFGGFHGGGVVGSKSAGQWSTNRSVLASPALVSALPRYHNGTPGAGLKSSEMLAVLKKGEQVLEESDPNHIKNRGKGGSGPSAPTPLRQVLVFGDDQVAGAMQGPAGEATTLTHIKRNAPMIKQLLRS